MSTDDGDDALADGDGAADELDDGPGSGGAPAGQHASGRDGPPGPGEAVHQFLTADGVVGTVREMVSSAALVLLAGMVLFAASGVWPPMVAVKSGSMQPHMHEGDLVFIMEETRLPADAAVEDTGVVTHAVATETGYRKFGDHGDVIVYRQNGYRRGDPIIHRAMFYVEEGENWYPRANPEYVRADDCQELQNCPAPNEGFITKGDNPRTNQYYDQARGMSRPVEPGWIEGKAMVRVPALGWIRLKWAELQRGGTSLAVAAVLVGGYRLRQAA